MHILSYFDPLKRNRRPRPWLCFAALGAGVYAIAAFGVMITLWNSSLLRTPKNDAYESLTAFLGNSALPVAAFALAASAIVWIRRPSGTVEITSLIVAAAFWTWFFAMEFPRW